MTADILHREPGPHPLPEPDSEMGLRITMVIRPRGEDARMEELREEVERLRSAGHDVQPRLTFEGGDAVRFAAAAARARRDLVVSVGGDGTLNEVVNGIRGARWQPRLAIVPTGTANDFAAGLGLPESIGEALEVAVRGRPRAVDVGKVNGRRFINASTGGFGAEATESASPETKKLLGAWAYLVTGVKKFVELRSTPARFVADGRSIHDGGALVFAVGNGRQTGGGTMLTPRAELGDGLLDLLVVPEMSRLDFIALLPDLRAGTHLQSADLIHCRVRQLEIVAEEELTVSVDGEPLRSRRLRYSVEPRPLSVMTP